MLGRVAIVMYVPDASLGTLARKRTYDAGRQRKQRSMTGWWPLIESLSLASLKPSRLLTTVTYSPSTMESGDHVVREISSVKNM